MHRIVRALVTLSLLASSAALTAPPAATSPNPGTPGAAVPRPNLDLSARAAHPLQTHAQLPPRPSIAVVVQQRRERSQEFAALPFTEAVNRQLPLLAAHLGIEEPAQLALTPAHTSSNALGQRLVTFKQEREAIEIFRGEITAIFDREQRLVATSGRPLAGPRTGRRIDFAFDAAIAVTHAYADLTGRSLDAGLLVRGEERHGYRTFTSSALTHADLPRLASPARTKPVLFPSEGALIPAWYVELELETSSTRPVAYAYVISALGKRGPLGKGALLLRHDLVSDADLTFRVWADATPPYTPHGGPEGLDAVPYAHPAFDPLAPSLPYAAPNVVTLPRAPRGTDPWLPEGATTTSGNNVHAFADLAPPDGFSEGDLLGETSAPDTFGFTFDPSLDPGFNTSQQHAAIAQLFFTINWLHDAFYPAGFDEASGNAQVDNYGRGGLGGDPIEAQAQDYNGINNANMLTRADGQSPRMQMFPYAGLHRVGLTVSAPEEIAGPYLAARVIGGLLDFSVQGQVVRGSFPQYCGVLTNGAELAGKIALVSRTTDWADCGFLQVRVALEAGAEGVLFEDNLDPGDPDRAEVYNLGFAPSKPVLTVSINTAAALDWAPEVPLVTMRRTFEADRDGTVDNAIVAHEWGHYLTNRLVGNGSGLSTNQAKALGEGWGDFVALLMLARADHASHPNNVDWSGVYPSAIYAAGALHGEKATYFGTRRLPYSTDLAKNPLTFKHIDDSQPLPSEAPIRLNGYPNAQPHNSGEVWATTLWEVYVSLLRAHPFQDAQLRMRNYLVAGLKLTPVNPTFTEARDALLAAARANDLEDFQRMGVAFARRGLGLGAVAPPRDSTTHSGVVESYETGAFPQIASIKVSEGIVERACDRDGVVDSGEEASVEMTIRNDGYAALQAGTLTVSSNATGAPASIATPPMGVGEEATVRLQLHPVFTASPAELELSVRLSAPGLAAPIEAQHVASANFDVISRFEETVDDHWRSPTWTSTVSPTSAGRWSDAALSTTADRMFVGPDNGLVSDLSLMSPPIQVGAGNFSVTFEHFFGFEPIDPVDGGYDGGVIELSTDETTWVDVGAAITAGLDYNSMIFTGADNPLSGRAAFSGESPGFGPDALRHTTTLDFGTAYANQTVRLRFRIGTDQAAGAFGWAIDNVVVSGATTGPFLGPVAEDGVCKNPPIAEAGEDVTVDERTNVMLSGSASDPDGDVPLTFAWTQQSGPAVSLEGADTAAPHFTAPEVSVDTPLVFELTVSDGELIATDTVTVTVRNTNPPVTEGPSGCGCTGGSTAPLLPAGLALLALEALRRRRGVRLPG